MVKEVKNGINGEASIKKALLHLQAQLLPRQLLGLSLFLAGAALCTFAR